MAFDIIQARLNTYTYETLEEEQDALKEILQELVLYALSTEDFFKDALFQGGTSLRILHKLPRFSEDLDFILKEPNKNFKWEPYFNAIVRACKEFGVEPEVIDKAAAEKNIQKMFLKDNSIGKILNLKFHHHAREKLRIKLEIDTNPPTGANSEIKFLDFPIDFSVASCDLPTNFSGKCHALLCREYIKGRDWYDFSWYVSRKTIPNFTFLTHAIDQQGPWASQKILVTPAWLIKALEEKIHTIDWKKAISDVEAFLRNPEKQSLSLWGVGFFQDKINKLKQICE